VPKGIYPRPAVGARAGEALAAVSLPPALEEACRNFEHEVGGRDALIHTLAAAELTQTQEYLVGAIADPRNDQASLARICAIHRIRFGELLQIFRNAKIMRAQVRAIQAVADALPEVAGDLMARALPHELPCTRCAATGTIRHKKRRLDKAADAEDLPCPVCQGRKVILVQPELETQRTALELGGLLQKGGSPAVQVNVQQNAGGGGGAGSHLDFLRRADQKLYQPPIEATAGPEEGEEA
jgi:hypothetical protein